MGSVSIMEVSRRIFFVPATVRVVLSAIMDGNSYPNRGGIMGLGMNEGMRKAIGHVALGAKVICHLAAWPCSKRLKKVVQRHTSVAPRHPHSHWKPGCQCSHEGHPEITSGFRKVRRSTAMLIVPRIRGFTSEPNAERKGPISCRVIRWAPRPNASWRYESRWVWST